LVVRRLFVVEVIMLRVFVSGTMFLVLILAAHGGDQPESSAKEFAKDLEQLNGSWRSPKVALGPGVAGHFTLKLEFKKDGTVGQATVLNFVSKGVFVPVGPSWVAELKEKDKKRFIVLAETNDGKRVEVAEIAYEVNGDKLKLTSPKALQVEKGKGGALLEMSGGWERRKADTK
jgi:hypothetical protein